jgi:hypothetical protein
VRIDDEEALLASVKRSMPTGTICFWADVDYSDDRSYTDDDSIVEMIAECQYHTKPERFRGEQERRLVMSGVSAYETD